MTKSVIKLLLRVSILFPIITGYSKVYKVGCINDYYPYVTTNNEGELTGVIIDWWKLWSEKTGVQIEFIPLDIQGCIEKTETGEIDIISGIFYSDERSEHINFSDPLMRMRTVIYLKKGGKIDSLENYLGLKLNTFKFWSALIKAIYLKDIDGFPYEIPNPQGNYKTPAPPKGYYLFKTLFTEKLRPAVKKGNRNLVNLIMSGAAKISDDELIHVVEKWDMFEEDQTQLWWFLTIGIVLLIIIVSLLIHSFRTNRKANHLIGMQL